MHYYRFLSDAEREFYGLPKDAAFITTRKIRLAVGLRTLTVPRGFVARGLGFSDHDFCLKPNWIGYEYLYAVHHCDRGVISRNDADLYLYNSYPSEVALQGDELYLNGSRVSGDDIWEERHQEPCLVVPEIVEPDQRVCLRCDFESRNGSALPGMPPAAAALGLLLLTGAGVGSALAFSAVV